MRPFVFVSLILLAILNACTATTIRAPAAPAAPPSRMVQTDDLATVVDAALDFADTLGTDAVLVVFDIDNTLLAMEQDLGSDQWWEWQRDLEKTAPCAPERVAEPLAVQGALYYASAMRPTQDDAAAQLGRLQQAGLRTLALTSRGPGFRLQTFRELRRHGFDFGSHTIGPDGGYPDDFLPPSGIRDARLEDGVFLTAGQHKGDMLADLLELTDTPEPAVIVMADDKEKNLQHVLDRFAGTGVSIQAYRYGREDATVEAFDPAEAARQWESVNDALRRLQEVFGPDHLELPASDLPPGCPAPAG
ncbi:DUF2608 domain-containing protein [Elongatibacter sediminis]|uniref:DUF2608 domain-containing protein n=1 Tax=Elongatibacter sediminis TaxID=3119006 RepID=A0AAW9RQH9_9GAMM